MTKFKSESDPAERRSSQGVREKEKEGKLRRGRREGGKGGEGSGAEVQWISMSASKPSSVMYLMKPSMNSRPKYSKASRGTTSLYLALPSPGICFCRMLDSAGRGGDGESEGRGERKGEDKDLLSCDGLHEVEGMRLVDTKVLRDGEDLVQDLERSSVNEHCSVVVAVMSEGG